MNTTVKLGYLNFVATIEAPVNCTEGEIRLYGGSKPNEGILHICTNGAWGTICLNSYWDIGYTNMACYELGYTAYCKFNCLITYKIVSFQFYLQTMPIQKVGQMRNIPSFSLH